MKYSQDIIYGFLRYWADKKPYKYRDQYMLFITRYHRDVKKYKINFDKLMRYFVNNQWIKGVGEGFYGVKMPFRYFMLTDKGDEYFRLLSVIRGGNFRFYKYFDREKAKS